MPVHLPGHVAVVWWTPLGCSRWVSRASTQPGRVVTWPAPWSGHRRPTSEPCRGRRSAMASRWRQRKVRSVAHRQLRTCARPTGTTGWPRWPGLRPPVSRPPTRAAPHRPSVRLHRVLRHL